MKRLFVVPIFVVMSALVLAQSRQVTMTFSPEEKTSAFNTAVDEYRAIWAAEGNRIIGGMEQISKLKFPEKSIKAQIYDASGAAIGSGFVVNSQMAGLQSQASVAILADGGFVITWEDDSSGTPTIKAQRYDAGGDLGVTYEAAPAPLT